MLSASARLCTLLLLTAAIAACAIRPLHGAVPDDLAAAAAPLEVHGRQGWMIDRHLAFGGWRADGVSFPTTRGHTAHCEPRCWGVGIGGWTKAFDDAVTTARAPLTFAWHAPGGETWHVRALGRIRQEDHVWLETWGRWSMASGTRLEQASFAGDILPADDDSPSPGWHFVLWSSSGDPREATLGWLEDAAGRHFDIEPLQVVADDEGRRVALPGGLPASPQVGYAIVDGARRHVAACDTVGAGRVWLRPGLASGDLVAVTATCAALLLRQPLGEPFGASR